MLDFFTRPWWSRVWVIQEPMVSKKAALVWGEQSLPWEAAARTILLFKNHLHWTSDSEVFTPPEKWEVLDFGVLVTAPIYRFHLNYRENPRRPLLGLLKSFWRSESTDARDKVDGLLGLATDGGEVDMRPDYEREVGSVYGQVVHDIMRRRGNLDVLSLC
jgi:hypothetical protein